MRGPYCTGALTPSGNAARVRAPQAAHLQSWARCSVTISGAGAGRSNTWRALWPTVISSVMADPQVAHDGGTWSMTWSGAATCSRVSPLCPFWPPDEPPLKLGDPRLQSRDLRRLRRDQRNQLFTRRLALRIRIRTHRILESKADSAVEKNLPAQPPRHATINLAACRTDVCNLIGND